LAICYHCRISSVLSRSRQEETRSRHYEEEDTCHTSYEEEDTCHISSVLSRSRQDLLSHFPFPPPPLRERECVWTRTTTLEPGEGGRERERERERERRKGKGKGTWTTTLEPGRAARGIDGDEVCVEQFDELFVEDSDLHSVTSSYIIVSHHHI